MPQPLAVLHRITASCRHNLQILGALRGTLCLGPKQDASCRHLHCFENTRTRLVPLMQVIEARAALKAADAALTAAKAECEAADERRRELAAELTLAQGALQGGSPGLFC